MATTLNQRKAIGARISSLRTKHHKKQSDLAIDIANQERVNINEALSIAAISSWESGRRTPNYKHLEAMSEIFGVSIKYLQCLTDDPYDYGDKINEDVIPDLKSVITYIDTKGNFSIEPEQLACFDGKPVYLTFKNYAHKEQWALVCKYKCAFITVNGLLAFNNETIDKVYVNETDYNYYLSKAKAFPLDMNALMLRKQVWVEMITPDFGIKTEYNGWYHHNETKTCLINENGLTLPYTGLNTGYYAYGARY